MAKVQRLNPKQKAFADYYLTSGNIMEAAVKAGYSENYSKAQGYKLLDNVGIKQYIDERMINLGTKRVADADEVLQYLTKVMRAEEKDQFGLDVSISDRTKAAELLGKRFRLFTDKVEIDNKKTPKVEVTFVKAGDKDDKGD